METTMKSKSKFDKMQSALEKKGYSEKASGAIAATIGREKYGKTVMAKAAAKGVSAASIAKKKK